ncbi:RNA-directed DNA polymerase from mobile element jockey-like [Brachionus plicatilis]|uniref:RNA-directed DNA polymerase from mobile element jockey-like n=1 Tax=Brachionus plicatilis TaxID=10195 RepID=A0A3M7P288_BRAPC|nr:RNA-directed DNA polymerase from mobile element jockey-like [Brachionus plicatilis]
MYADDVILLTNNIDELNRLLKITEKYGSDFEIKFNPNKTSYIVLFDNKTTSLQINQAIVFQGENIKKVIMMKYLGVWIDERLKSKLQFDCRIKSFNMAFYNLKRCGITCGITTTEIKMCYYKTYTRPLLYYGLDNLVLNKTQIKKLQNLESSLVKAMFLIPKRRTRSTKLLLACKIDKVHDLRFKTKIQFAYRLLQYENTNKLIRVIGNLDNTATRDKNSLFYELNELVDIYDKSFEEVVIHGMREICKIEKKNRAEKNKPEIKEVSNALKMAGDERTSKLKSLLYINID